MVTDAPRPLHRRGQPNPSALEPHPPWAREVAFTAWCAANRNGHRAHGLLKEYWPEDQPFRDISAALINQWARRENWHGRLDAVILEHHAALRIRLAAKALHYTDRSLDILAEVQDSDGFIYGADGSLRYDKRGQPLRIDARLQATRVNAAVALAQIAGAGTLGTRDRAAPNLRPITTELPDFSQMSDAELGRWEAEATFRTRTDDTEGRAR